LTVASLTGLPSSQLYVRRTATALTKAGAKRSRELRKGTFILANSGFSLGIAKILDIDCCANDGIAAVIGLDDRVFPPFLANFINSITDYLRETVATGNDQPNLNTDRIGRIYVPIPPLPEQQAAAEALADADALIEGLVALITKKRDIKHGAMQELLTGERRLPGFEEGWHEINLAQRSHLRARIGWQGLTTDEYLSSGDYYLVTGTDFVAGNIKWERCCFVERERFVQDSNIQLKHQDILLTKDGTIGKIGYVDYLPGPSTLNSGIFVIRPKNEGYEPLFVYYVLCSGIFDAFLNRLQAGSTIVHLYQKDLVHFKFKAPPADEQRAIAAVLSDMDAEIVSLEEKLTKARAMRQGMMQVLLTGEIRLK
jgi:type I restriction enzyme S subunit